MNTALIEKYSTILKDIDERFLDPDKKTSPNYAHLSGLFLPSVSDKYFEAKNNNGDEIELSYYTEIQVRVTKKLADIQ